MPNRMSWRPNLLRKHTQFGRRRTDAIGASTTIGRAGDPMETGAVAAFLASSDSSFMTGGEVFVDGGLAQV